MGIKISEKTYLKVLNKFIFLKNESKIYENKLENRFEYVEMYSKKI